MSDPKAVSFGAEALSPQAEEEAENSGWRMAKYFKLHLHPSDLTNKHKLRLRRKWLQDLRIFNWIDMISFSVAGWSYTSSDLW